jgi:predicted ATPase
VVPAITHVLGVEEPRGGPSLAAVKAYLARKNLLLIFDNCEHVITEVARVSGEILRAAPLVRILATSREPLKISSERIYRLNSLEIPAAIELFAERAKAVDHRFVLTEDNTLPVTEICRRLDCIPLAIELAAALVTVLPVRSIHDKLQERFAILGDTKRDAIPRQQTLSALINWSYELLSPAEQRLFEQLSVFSGGCTLATATLVCGDGQDENEILSLLASLVDKSLVAPDINCDEPRYFMLESTLHYAREKLAHHGERETLAHRHARVFYDIVAEIERAWYNMHDPAWQAEVDADLDNWRAALEWTLLTRGDMQLGQRFAGVLRPIWTLGFGLAEGRRWVDAAFALVKDSTPLDVLAQLEFADALILHQLAESSSAVNVGKRVLAHYRELGDPLRVAAIESVVGEALLYLERQGEAEPLLLEALKTSRKLDTQWLTASLLAMLAHACSITGRQVEAREHYAEALAAFHAVGDERGVANTSANLAEAEFLAGNREEALRIARHGLATEQTPDLNAFANVAAYLIALDRFDGAEVRAREGVELARERQQGVALAWSLQHVAATAALRPLDKERAASERGRAARLLGFVNARIAAFGVPRQYTEQQEYDRASRSLREALGREEYADLIASGAVMTEDQAIEVALSP